MAILVYLNGPEEGSVIHLKYSIIIGQSTEGRLKTKHYQSGLHVPVVLKFDDSISQRHCIFQLIGESVYRMIDNDSTNGSYLNGQRIEVSVLKHLDFIRIGKTVFQYRMEEQK